VEGSVIKEQKHFNLETKTNMINILETYIKEKNISYKHFLKTIQEPVLFTLLKNCGSQFKTYLKLPSIKNCEHNYKDGSKEKVLLPSHTQ
jgi:hypothetical protein